MEDKIVNLKIKADLQPVKKGLEDVKKGTEDIGQASSLATSKIDSLTGGAISGFKGMFSGLTTVAAGFTTVGGAIALSGLGLLVLVIASVTAAFKGSEEGQNKFAKIMSVIGVVTGNLIDVLASLGEKIISVFESPRQSLISFGNLLKENVTNRINGLLELLPAIGKAIKLAFAGEFEKAGTVAFNAVSKVTTGIENTTSKLKGLVKGTQAYIAEQQREMKLGAQVADMRAKSDLIDRKLLVDRAKMESKISDLKLKSRDIDNNSAQQRAKFLQEATKIEDSLLLREQESLSLKFQAQKTENTFSRTNKENADKEAQAQANLSNIETRRNDNKKATLRELNRVNKEIRGQEKLEASEKQKVVDEANKVRTDAAKKVSDETKAAQKKSSEEANAIKTALEQSQETPAQKENREFLEKKTSLEANNLSVELLEKVHQENLNKITTDSFAKDAELAIKKTADNKAENDKRIADDKAVTDAKLAILNSELNNASAAIELAKGLFGKNKALQKAALIAESAIGVAKIIINTQAANAAAKLKYALLPGGQVLSAAEIISNKIGAGIGIASNIAATAKGLSALGGGSAPGGSVGGGGGGGTPTPAAPAFNVIGASPTNQLAQTIGRQNDIPIKTYVVSGEMTTAQALDRNIVKSATLG